MISVTTCDGLSARPSQRGFLVLQQAPRHNYPVSHVSCSLLRSPGTLVPCCGLLVSLGWPWKGREQVLLCVLLLQSHPTLRHPMDYSPPDFSVHGTLQARILEWVAIPFSRGPSRPRDRIHVYFCCIGRQVLYHCGFSQLRTGAGRKEAEGRSGGKGDGVHR